MTAVLLAGSFIVFLLMGIPVAFAMGLSSLLVILATGLKAEIIPQMITVGVQSYPLMAVPFFIFAGNLMNSVGVTQRIFDFTLALIGHIRGGLGHVNVVASLIFAGISGSAAADAAGLGAIETRKMIQEGYGKSFSAAISAASAMLGPIIPPSIIMIIYAVEANVSITKMFLAGILPGFLIALALMATIYYLAVTGKEVCPTRPRATRQQIWTAFKGGILAVVAPIIILAGLVGGIATPTETGVLAVAYSLLVGLIYGEVKLRHMPRVIKESLTSTGQVMFLLASATLFGWVVTSSRIPQMVSEYLVGLSLDTWAMLLILNVFYLILGCFIEATAALIITLPVIMPVVHQLGIDPVHFGVIVCFNLMIGLITPPMGMGLFIMSSIVKAKFEEVLKSSIPFLIVLLIALLIVTYVPGLSTWLPNLLSS